MYAGYMMNQEVAALSKFTLIQVLYLTAFASVHSLLASRQFKRVVWQAFGPGMDRWYMNFFSLFTIITITPLVLLLLLFPGRRLYIVPSPWRWLMIGGQLLASTVTRRAFSDAPHRFSIGQQLSGPKDPDHMPLGIRGVYCWIRDPFLLSGLAQMWLTPLMTTRLLMIYILTSVYLYLGSLHWESRLLAQFGKEYEDYQRRMPRLIPRLIPQLMPRGCNLSDKIIR